MAAEPSKTFSQPLRTFWISADSEFPKLSKPFKRVNHSSATLHFTRVCKPLGHNSSSFQSTSGIFLNPTQTFQNDPPLEPFAATQTFTLHTL